MKIKFIAEREDYGDCPDLNNNVTLETVSDPTLDDLIQSFEDFVKGCGYYLPEGAHLGYEYETPCKSLRIYDDELS